MKRILNIIVIALFLLTCLISCTESVRENTELSAETVLYKFGSNAMAYGGYRSTTRDSVPTVDELKEDMLILNAMGCHLIRTYNTQQYGQVKNLLSAIQQLKELHEDFEMYVMLGTWIQCKNAWTSNPIREKEDSLNNHAEIEQAIDFAQTYPDIIKIIAVGNEAMVDWASSYHVTPKIILKYVKELQRLKQSKAIDPNIWITSSDNFASWGGGSSSYHKEDLKNLIQAVDYVSIHVYPFHDTHYQAEFWRKEFDGDSIAIEQLPKLMDVAVAYAVKQYLQTKMFVRSIDSSKSLHIGETGWASSDNSIYGLEGSGAADEYKQSLYYHKIRNWCQQNEVACFYFEAFDEPWKDANNLGGSENHFGLLTIDSKLKLAIWEQAQNLSDQGLKRGNLELKKTHNGDSSEVLKRSIKSYVAP